MNVLPSTFVILLLVLEVSTQSASLRKIARCGKPKLVNARVSCTAREYAGKYLDGTSCRIYCQDNYIFMSGPETIDCYRGRWLHGGEGNTPYSTPTRCQKRSTATVIGRSSINDQEFSQPATSHDGRCSNKHCDRWYYGIPQKICKERGCCWDLKKGQCYKFLVPKCQIAFSERSKCPETWRGIPRQMCENIGCCYNAESKTCYSALEVGEIEVISQTTQAPHSGDVSPCSSFEKSLPNGRLECTRSNEGVTCTAKCNEFHMLKGSDARSCHLMTGELSPGSWECRREYCKEIPALPKTFIDCTDGQRIGSVCTATCARGFQLFDSGRNMATCLQRGEWSEPTSWQCRETLCEELNVNDRVTEGGESFDGTRATLDCTSGRKYGSVCTVSCPLGYHLLGTSTIRCGVDGEWSTGTFKCIPLSCSTPFVPANVVYTCSNEFKVGSVCRFRCPRGFQLGGALSTTCRANQRWSYDPELTKCIVTKECEVPYLPEGARVQHCTAGYNVGSLCSIKCPDGKLLRGSNTNTIACMGNLDWHKTFEGETCDGCGDLKSDYPDADWDKLNTICTGGNKIGSVCEITCGSHGEASSVLVCTRNDKGELAWDNSPPLKCYDLATKPCDVDVDLSTGKVTATAASKQFIKINVTPVVPTWMRRMRGGASKCRYQSLIKIDYERLLAVALRMSYDVPSSVHFELSSAKARSKNTKSLTGKNFQLQRTPGTTLRGFFQSRSEISLILDKKSSEITFTKGSAVDKAIPMDFRTEDSLYIGLNRAVTLLSDYDISRMGKGMCRLCVAYSEK